nr:extensin family protein [Amylibacter sp.]
MARWRIIVLACAMLSIGAVVAAAAQDRIARPVLRPLALEAKHDKTAAPVFVNRPKLRPFDQGQSRSAAMVQKVVLEQTITEDITLRKVSKAQEPAQTLANDPPNLVTVKTVLANPQAVALSPRPQTRPSNLQLAMAVRKDKAGKPVKYRKKGSVCGIKGIRGYSVKRVRGKGGCGIDQPVKITEIDGVKLTREALVGCDAARALYGWVQQKAKPTVGRRGGGLAKIQVIAGYSCRNRNSAKGGRLSEHAKGNAIDISGFILKNGTSMSVLRDWRSTGSGPTLKRLHKTACGPFKTVLGPNANRFHQDHFHFDVAKHRGGGSYCR